MGTELDRLTGHQEEWRRIIAEVREVTAARLTFASNWTHFENVPFWDALDAVGVQAYFPLSEEMLASIVRLQLDRIVRRVKENHAVPLVYGDDVVKLIISRCSELESGGRMIDAILTNTVLPRISQEYLTRLAQGQALQRVRIGVTGGDFAYEFD